LRDVCNLAAEHRIAVIMPMEWASPNGLLDLAFVVNANGTIQGAQTKNQLAPEEELTYVPGDRRHLFEVAGVPFGIVICHEGWRYPETATSVVAPNGRCVDHLRYGEESLLVVDRNLEAATGPYARIYAPERYGD